MMNAPSTKTGMRPRTQPPMPNPQVPKLKLPADSVDCHIHLFGPAERYAFSASSRYVSDDMLPETYIALQQTLGLDKAVLVSGGGYGTDTRHLKDVLTRFPDRFRGIALLAETTTIDEMAELDALGVRGLRFVGPSHGGGLPQISPRMAAMAHEFGWHVQFYPHSEEILEVSDRLLALPNSAIVLDHFANIPAAGGTEQPAFRRVFEMLETGRVWVKLSGPMRCTLEEPPYPSVTPLACGLVEFAPERMVWGTDWPHVNMNGRTMPDDGLLVDLLSEWIPDEKRRTEIVRDNARRLYGFDPA
ncbi:amidohydrolase family protein [Chelativorans sp. AA-79]|uniref:amidohydrolase family protein n=1 Tax=Chelativorans sp. AA-79 TaxID=3028735 RepID=UPI0023F6FEA5|nr:amidohydrolase family protein [Chelativorans sp. AA-79]WEX10764.1 amidohydrolase family protein [Chelativorans sp. AA-79]